MIFRKLLVAIFILYATAYAQYDAGNFAEDATIVGYFNTNCIDGSGCPRTTDGTIRVYEDNNTTEYTGGAITDYDSFDSYDGLNTIVIDTDYDATADTFFRPGHFYMVAVTGATIDGIAAVNAVVFIFRIENDYVNAEDVEFDPGDADCWNAGDPGDASDALDELCDNLSPLLPSAAPVLDDISWTSTEGVSGKNTWNSANPIAGYIEADDAGSVNNAGDACDITMGTSGNEHGVMDYDTAADKTGVLNDDVTATDNYPADCFGPGGSDGGATNDLKLLLNGSILHTVDLLTFGNGDSLNVNGSGFKSLLDDTPVYFADLTPFPPRTYRTGEWYLDAAEMVKGYNVVKIQHVTDAGTQSTTVEEFLLDDNNTATSYSNEAFSGYPGAATTKDLSGVTYHNGTVTATYAIDIDDAYRNTISTSASAVSHPTTTNCAVSSESLGNSGCNEALQKAVSTTATVDVTRITGANIVVSTQTDRTVQADGTSGGATQSECLVDRDTQTNTDLAHYYADEGKRIKSNEDFNTNIAPTWDGAESLVDAGSAGYNNGLQVTEDNVYYPGEATVDDYSSLTSGPVGNPDYSVGVSGTRYYFGQFYDATGRSNFALVILGSATLVNEGTLDASTDEVSIAIRLPTQTGWMDINQDYVANQWGSTAESATATATVGCYAATYGSDKTIPTNSPRLGFTVGTKTTDDSYDKIYYRITAPQGWTGYISSITITWGAS